jgi:hypothetical protein
MVSSCHQCSLIGSHGLCACHVSLYARDFGAARADPSALDQQEQAEIQKAILASLVPRDSGDDEVHCVRAIVCTRTLLCMHAVESNEMGGVVVLLCCLWLDSCCVFDGVQLGDDETVVTQADPRLDPAARDVTMSTGVAHPASASAAGAPVHVCALIYVCVGGCVCERVDGLV